MRMKVSMMTLGTTLNNFTKTQGNSVPKELPAMGKAATVAATVGHSPRNGHPIFPETKGLTQPTQMQLSHNYPK